MTKFDKIPCLTWYQLLCRFDSFPSFTPGRLVDYLSTGRSYMYCTITDTVILFNKRSRFLLG
jgi:hypothetical protein